VGFVTHAADGAVVEVWNVERAPAGLATHEATAAVVTLLVGPGVR
jgi:hypothetical protein